MPAQPFNQEEGIEKLVNIINKDKFYLGADNIDSLGFIPPPPQNPKKVLIRDADVFYNIASGLRINSIGYNEKDSSTISPKTCGLYLVLSNEKRKDINSSLNTILGSMAICLAQDKVDEFLKKYETEFKIDKDSKLYERINRLN